MAKLIKCDCGVTLRGETDDELVAAATTHARDAHSMTVTREQILAIAEIA